jgi:hypothetical protein
MKSDLRAEEAAAAGSRLDAFKSAIDEMLRTDLDAPCEQRHKVRRIYCPPLRLSASAIHASPNGVGVN